MTGKPPHVLQVGAFGFPHGMAAIEKIRLLCRSLISVGVNSTVISRKGVHDPEKGPHFPPVGTLEGISYVYATGSVYRPDSFLQRNLMKLKGWWQEALLIRRYSRETHLTAVIVHSMDFPPLLFYWVLSRIYGFKMIYLLVEHNSATTSRQKPLLRISDFLLENYGLKLADGVMPISEYLINFLAEKAPGKPYIKIPALTEFDRFEKPRTPDREKFFLYCGSVAYLEVIFFILDAFAQLGPEEDLRLYLVIGGDDAGKQAVHERIAGMQKKDQVRTFTRLPYDELVQLYVDAIGLLIPLRHTPQDTARFPHKIGEYLASGNPLITTAVGEIPLYFTDGENALITDDYVVEQYVEKMQFILDQPEAARQIGRKGQQMGRETFDYPIYGPLLVDFIEQLSPQSKATEYVRN